MKSNLSPIITLLFIALSIYLSILIKNKNQQLTESERTLNAQNQEIDDYKYQTDLLQECILLNLSASLGKISDNELFSRHSERDMTVLYLKTHVCSPCNMPLLKRIIPLAAKDENFMVLSHDSNKHFLSPMLEEVNFIKIEWLNDSLYSGENDHFDGELVILDNNGCIKATIPVEYLKDELIFKMVLPELSDANFSK